MCETGSTPTFCPASLFHSLPSRPPSLSLLTTVLRGARHQALAIDCSTMPSSVSSSGTQPQHRSHVSKLSQSHHPDMSRSATPLPNGTGKPNGHRDASTPSSMPRYERSITRFLRWGAASPVVPRLRLGVVQSRLKYLTYAPQETIGPTPATCKQALCKFPSASTLSRDCRKLSRC